MHAAAHDYVARFRTDDDVRVVEIGSRDINGTVRDLFPDADYIGVDVQDGQGVDVVADAATWRPKRKADIVVCCEVFEHTDAWRDIIWNTADNIVSDGGLIVVTAAGPGRAPHSAVDGGPLRDDEFYENIHPGDLALVLAEAGFDRVEVDEVRGDVRASGVLNRG